ncbi:MAG: hypothetical protein U1A77_15680 [Pirellulales bacterium]
MYTTRDRLRPLILVVVSLAFWMPDLASAQSDKEAAIDNCLGLVRMCQLKDGAFRMKADGNPVWIRPYFGNYAAIALLSGKKAADRARVEAWLNWYAKAQLADGSINDWEGGLDQGYMDNGQRDSVDSYASTYLVAVERYQRVARKLPKSISEAAKRSFDALLSVYDDGLTWDKQERRMKYLQDNVETYGGFVAAERLFAALGDQATEKAAKEKKEAVAAKLMTYFRTPESLFAYVLHDNGTYQVHESNANQRLAATGMANLVGLAWISSRNPNPWSYVNREFAPDGGNAPQAPVERWYLASLHAGTKEEVGSWRQRTIAEARSFRVNSVYVHRPAITALSLIEGTDWLPRLENDG